MLKLRMNTLLRAEFLRREDGSVAIETVILLPMLFWAYLSMFSIFDAFRQYSINQKAAFTISDMISRETLPIDNAYLDGAQDLLDYMTRSRGDVSLRVSVVTFDANRDIYKRDWSQTRGTAQPLTNNDVRDWHGKLPVLAHNDRLVLVETWTDYDPPFNTGLEDRVIRNFVFTRPRYAPRVLWDPGNAAAGGV